MSKITTKQTSGVVITIVLIVIASVIGYRFAKVEQKELPKTAEGKQESTSSPLFQSQSATVVGKITNISGNKVTVIDDKNNSAEFTLSDKFVIYKPVKGTKSASPSASIADIEANRLVSVLLELNNKEYRITSLAYFPEVASAKIASPSAKPNY